MSIVSKIIVSGRLENGDTVDVSLKVTNRAFSTADASVIRERISDKLKPCVDDTLYYQVRTWGGNAGRDRKNWSRVPTLDALDEVISEVMCK